MTVRKCHYITKGYLNLFCGSKKKHLWCWDLEFKYGLNDEYPNPNPCATRTLGQEENFKNIFETKNGMIVMKLHILPKRGNLLIR